MSEHAPEGDLWQRRFCLLEQPVGTMPHEACDALDELGMPGGGGESRVDGCHCGAADVCRINAIGCVRLVPVVVLRARTWRGRERSALASG